MAPVKRSYDEETQCSSWTNEHPGSPVKRPRSEPSQTLPNFNNSSIEVSLSPPASDHHQINCPWCSEFFDAPEDGVFSAHNALKEHIALAHPRIANLSVREDEIKEEDSDITMADHHDLVNGHLKGVLSSHAAVTAPATDADVTPIGSQTPELGLSARAAESLDSKLHDLERQQVHAANAEKRLMKCWNLHDARKFNPDYDNTTADLEDTWCYIFDDSKSTNKKTNGKKLIRPDPYLSDTTEKGGFLKITPVDKYLDTLTNFESMPTDQLQAAAQNVYHALKTWQDEWMAIEDLSKRVTTKPKKSSNPRALDPPEVFRDKKEAMLYGYKYDASIHEPKKREANNNETTFKCQDPFVQGGFRPTAAQLRKMQTEVGKNNSNPDNFRTMTRNGQEYAPKFQDPPLIPFDARGSTNRKRKLPQGEIAALRHPSVHDSTTAFESDLDGQPFKRVTRSVNKTENPQTQTAPPSPGTRPRGGKKRRGQKAQPVNNTTITSQPTNLATNVAFQTVTSNTAGTPTDNTFSTANETAPSSRAITSPPADGMTSVSGSEQADITPAPMPALAPAAPGAPPALATLPQNLAEPGEVLSEAELRRRDKIANSKNPRRTMAMLDHWGKFHKDGRTRKPKRTKEQMEADRLAEEARRANGQNPPRKRRRKAATSTVDSAATQQQTATASTTTMATATSTTNATATVTATASGSTIMSLQPLSIQPAATSTSIAPVAPPPLPPARTMNQVYPIPLNEPPRPQPSRSFPSLHPLIPIAPPERQPAMTSYTSQPVLPSVDRNTAPPRWTAPSQYYTYGNPPPPSPYHPYGQTQYPPPPPPAQLHQPRRDTGRPETMQPSANYPFDVRRPRPPLPPLQNPPRP
ncbi:uncharacterized protein BHQ10_007278 [Talaromyces amestolkiae]|uniref:Uncharacterized protein n=1 Tax=Talaromyces amestolkiae TaxID=1196081 RepID=A0A364L645_TALAM|nr:uncharacterized protein BHQ10_007278 [Talaromyces amestolkiae]RAO71266.1 hypothetical protein BHQ10_007278 [Talaromyces amestolkiae]